MFGLTSQLRRSAGSVAIAEGQGRLSKGEFRQFLGQARGSLIEMETQLVIAGNLGVLSSNTIAALIEPLRGSKPPSTRADEVSSTSLTYGKN
jgi:four helix bundle protein